MKISYGWLKEYINVDLEPTDVAKLLTDTGLEVEGIEQIESIKGGLKGIVIGEVVEKIQHPNADRLSVTKVNIGQEELLQIVCGAPNIDKGQKVAVATIGAVLYSGQESFKIKKGKIRGEASQGMICAEDEIGLGSSHEGIMVLDSSAKVGTEASKYFNLESDFVFEIGLTPNRSDAMSHIGVARDLRAALNQNGDNHSLNIPEIKKHDSNQKENSFSIEIENHDLCPRYAGVCLNNIKVEPSPEWLKKRLESIGLSPINNVVDITNFVLHETGQPLHAFDLEKINGNKIIVRNLEQNTSFTTLDEVERKLSNEDLIICDRESKPMCLAGVFGGLQSGVSNKTTSIFLESAYFNPVSVRKTSKRHNLNTDASFRFERGVDPNNVVYPVQRAVDLLVEICGAQLSSDIIDIYPKKIEEATLNLSLAKVTKLIGQEIPEDNIYTILKDLDIEVLEKKDGLLAISIPTYRTDVTRQEDVVEEILRIYGYNNIAIPSQVLSSVSSINKPNAEKIQNTISDFLSSNGFNECINNSLTKSSYIDLIEEIDKKEQVILLNPLSQDLNAMRQSMIFGGLENISFNLNRKSSDIKIYEFGKTYSLLEGNQFKEDRKLSLFACGNQSIENWNGETSKKDYFWIKKQVEHVLIRLGIQHFKTENIEISLLIDGFCYKIGRDVIATIGSIHPKVTSHFSIKKEIFYGELNWDLILRSSKNAKTSFKSISKFPSVKRDLALLIDENIPFSTLEKIAKQTEKKYLKEIQLFDVYKGDKLEKGKKSYALSFLLEDQEKTLTDKQIDKVMDNLINAFKQKADAEVRM
jgi:phenylalanyl-tRNA synthetase beta chain